MGPDNGPVGLCRLQFGGEALGPDGLLGVVLPSLILLSKELVDVLHHALIGTRKGTLRVGGIRRIRGASLCKKLKIRTKSECDD